MMDTLYSMNLLNSFHGLAIATLIGFLFGLFLEISGFGSSRKLTDIFYFRDMSVLKVMFSAVLVALIGYQYLSIWGIADPHQIYCLETYLGAQAIGGLLFGVGFVVGGWCPGTALVGLASLKWDALVFLLGGVVGSIIFNETYDSVRPLYESGYQGVSILPETLSLSTPLFIILMSIGALILFAFSTWIEEKRKFLPLLSLKAKKKNQWLGLLLILVSAILFVLPEAPKPQASEENTESENTKTLSNAVSVELFQEIVEEKDHLDSLIVADLLIEGKSDLRLIDIRPEPEYQEFHLRGAIHMPLEEMASRANVELPKESRIILYSNGTTHAAQAWVLLRQMGYSKVVVLLDGITGFIQECLTPPSLSGFMEETAAKAHYAKYQKRHDYFFNTPATALIEKKSEEILASFVPGGLDSKLVSVDWLASQLNNPDLRILDVRDKSTEYTTSHIPNAIYLNTENIRSTIGGIPSQLLPAQELATLFGRAGISEKNPLILYDQNLRNATLFAVALDRLGHSQYAILQGGFEEWLKKKLPVNSQFPTFEAQIYPVKPFNELFSISIEGVQKTLTDPKTLLIDVRPEEYYRGEKSEESRPGHIPGAINRTFSLDIVSGKALFKTEAFLKQEYEKLGLKDKSTIIVSCRTGHQASQTYFVLKYLLKYPNVRWFGASWSGWAAQPELPAEMSPKK
ncbi:MAG: DUF6691 family protein [Planctomycetota bacterium]